MVLFWFPCLCYLLSGVVRADAGSDFLVIASSNLEPVKTVQGEGFLDVLSAEWFARSGLDVKLVAMPAERGLADANAGLLDGELVRVELPQVLYPNLRQVPEPVIQVSLAGFTIDRKLDVGSLADLDHYRVGYIRGWKMLETLLENHPHATPARKVENLLEMLENERIDVALLSVVPTRYLMDSKDIEGLIDLDFRIARDSYLYLHSRHSDLIPLLVNTLKAMKQDGSYDAIMAGYIAENH